MIGLTLAEAAERTGLSAATLRRRCGAGQIPGAELKGKTWVIPERSLAKIGRIRAPRMPREGEHGKDSST